MLKFLRENEEQVNTHELENCLRNLVVVSTILGKGQDTISKHFQELIDQTDGNDILVNKANSVKI